MGNISHIVLDDETLEVEDTKARIDIGDTTTLKTSAKDSLVNAMNEVFQSASDLKAKIASAITGKGIATSQDATGDVMAANISAIPTGIDTSDATATAEQLIYGATAYGSSGKLTGIMQNRSGTTGWCGYETVSVQAHPSAPDQAQVTVPNTYNILGYYDNTSAVTANVANLNASNIRAGISVGRIGGDSTNCIVGTFTADATADSSKILSGYTAGVKGTMITGNIPDRGTYSGGCSSAVIYENRVYLRLPYGYYHGGSYDTNGGEAEVYIPYADLAVLLGVNASYMLSSYTLCGVTGTAPNIQFASGTATSFSVTSGLNMQAYYGSNGGGTQVTSFGAIDITMNFVPNLVVIKNLSVTGESVNRKGMAIYSTLFNPFPGYEGIITMGYYGDFGAICITTTNQNSGSPFYWGTTCRFAVSEYTYTGESSQWYAFRI